MAISTSTSGDWSQNSAFNTIDDCLIATLQEDANEPYIRRLESDVLTALQISKHQTLIMDATPLKLIDATDFDRLRRVIDMARLMGVDTIIVGLQPGVVAGLVELDANIDGLVTTLNMEAALQVAGRWK